MAKEPTNEPLNSEVFRKHFEKVDSEPPAAKNYDAPGVKFEQREHQVFPYHRELTAEEGFTFMQTMAEHRAATNQPGGLLVLDEPTAAKKAQVEKLRADKNASDWQAGEPSNDQSLDNGNGMGR